MTGPTFLVIGAQKSGSTWLAQILSEHPEVFTPDRKELHFFDRPEGLAKGIGWYEAHFRPARGHRALGEATPDYLWSRGSRTEPAHPSAGVRRLLDSIVAEPSMTPAIPALVHEHYPNLQLLVILRDPVRRALSAFRHHIRQGRISPRARFADAVGRYGILEQGFYDAHLAAWSARYPWDRFKVLIYEDDLLRHPEAAAASVYRHLGVDDSFVPPGLSSRFNEGVNGLYLHLNYYAGRLTKPLFRAFPALRQVDLPRLSITDDDVDDLRELYADDVSRLSVRLGRSLDRWDSWSLVASRPESPQPTSEP